MWITNDGVIYYKNGNFNYLTEEKIYNLIVRELNNAGIPSTAKNYSQEFEKRKQVLFDRIKLDEDDYQVSYSEIDEAIRKYMEKHPNVKLSEEDYVFLGRLYKYFVRIAKRLTETEFYKLDIAYLRDYQISLDIYEKDLAEKGIEI
ncbi:MAG: hypothetical protein ACTSPQ_22585 [Candidatus Helarchaeota archaeon]